MRISVVILVSCLLATCPLAGLVTAAHAQLLPVINEFVFNHTGTDDHEFIEIFGASNTDLSSYFIIDIEGDSGAGPGIVDNVFNVGTTNSGGFWTTGFLTNVLENGTATLFLVSNFTGAVAQDLDTDNDGVLDVTPWTSLIDSVAVFDGGVSDLAYGNVLLAPGFDGGSLPVGGASRIPNGLDTNSVADWVRNDFDGAGLPGFVGTLGPGEALNTPGAVNAIPEPATLLVAGLGILALGLGKRR
jgi:hypothetical protein